MSKSRAAMTTDQDITRRLEANDATHNLVYLSSVGATILKLRDHYLGKNPTEKSLNDLYEDCCKNLDKLTVTDFFKAGEIDLPQNLALKEEINATLPSLIALIKTKMNEAPTQLDSVSMYLPDADQQGRFHKQNILFPLKVIFPLLMTAFSDDKKFANSYENMSAQEQLAQATADRPLRYFSIYRCLERFKTGICHTGVRNELVTQLNGIYEGIHILEDADATANAYLTERVYSLFDSQYKTYKNDDDKKALLNSLYEWMLGDSNTNLLSKIDPNQSMKEELKQMLIDHAINPEEYKDNLDKTYNTLPFKPDHHGYPTLAYVHTLLNAHADSTTNDDLLGSTVMWIKNNFILGNKAHEDRIKDTVIAYVTYQKIRKYNDLLITTGQKTEEIIQSDLRFLKKVIEGDVNELSLLPTDRTQLNKINDELTQLECNSFKAEIETIFHLWDESDPDNMKKIYVLLTSQRFIEAAMCSDDTLKQLKNKHIEQEDGSIFLKFTPYYVNRLFLHAILTNPNEWTETFSNTLEMLMTEIKKARNNQVTLSRNDREWINSPSYITVIAQLEYLQAINRSQNPLPNNPYKMLILPLKIRTVGDWIRISPWISAQQRYDTYLKLRPVLMPEFATQFSRSSYPERIIRSIPEGLLKEWFLSLIKQDLSIHTLISIILHTSYLPENDCVVIAEKAIDKISKQIVTENQFNTVVNKIPEKHFLSFCSSIKNNLGTIFKSGKSIIETINALSENKRNIAYNSFKKTISGIFINYEDFLDSLKVVKFDTKMNFIMDMKDFLENIKVSLEQFNIISQAAGLDTIQSKIVFDTIKDYMLSIIRSTKSSIQKFKILYNQFSPKECVDTIMSEKDDLPDIITTMKDFEVCINMLQDDIQKSAVYDVMKAKLPSMMSNLSTISDVVISLPHENKSQLLTILENQLPELIKSSGELVSALRLSRDVRSLIYKAIKNGRFNQLAVSVDDFISILKYLPPKDFSEFYEAMKNKLPDMMNSIDSLNKVALALPSNYQTHLVELLETKLPDLIISSDELDTALRTFAKDARSHVYKVMKNERLAKFVISDRILSSILEHLPPAERLDFYDAVKDKTVSLTNAQSVVNILTHLPCDKHDEFYEKNKNEIIGTISSLDDYILIRKNLNINQIESFTKLCAKRSNIFIKSSDGLLYILDQLSHEDKTATLDSIMDNIASFITSYRYYKFLLDRIPLSLRDRFYAQAFKALPRIIKSTQDMLDLLYYLPLEKHPSAIFYLKDSFYKTIKINLYLEDPEKAIGFQHPEYNNESSLVRNDKLLIYIIDSLPNIITSTQDLHFLFRSVSEKTNGHVFEIMKPVIPTLINSNADLVGLVKGLPNRWNDIYLLIKDKFNDIVKSNRDLSLLVAQMTSEDLSSFCSVFKDQLPRFIQSTDDLKNIIMHLTTADKFKVFFKSFNDHILDILKSSDDVNEILVLFSNFEWIFYHTSGDVLSRIVNDNAKTTLPKFLQIRPDPEHIMFRLYHTVRSEFYNSIQSTLPSMIKSVKCFKSIISLLNDSDKITFIESLRGNESSFINHLNEIDDLFQKNLDSAILGSVYELTKFRLLELANSGKNFAIAFSKIVKNIPEKQTDFFEIAIPKLSDMIKSSEDFYAFYPLLSLHQRTYMFEAVKNKLPSITSDIIQWNEISSNLTYVENIQLLREVFKNPKETSKMFMFSSSLSDINKTTYFVSQFIDRYNQAPSCPSLQSIQFFGKSESKVAIFSRLMSIALNNPNSPEARAIREVLDEVLPAPTNNISI